ncbi:hypothetical protein [Engelhardtia mirabilis]|uniref:DUF5673 domain-containing protein n=1 Tax=Engelhardtia mirabilis TaxID=2528011 RepID=A0A518BIV0_9BACT|nr:hypothetical protein Pla133_19700 [Planctomycetes bacterium Pla133]QDV01221.1 hypothetical protein Pla86_19700 [Planctomycetes bacterium Pla86]
MTALQALESATGLLLLAAIVHSLRLRARAQRLLGEQLGAEWGRVWSRFAVAVPAATAAIWIALSVGLASAAPELALLVGAVVLVIVRPSFDDRVCGSLGLRAGWHVLAHDELEEWRLIGEHLRFRLFGEWVAVPLPVEHQVAVRERLVALVPERESAFGPGTGRPAYDPVP